MIPGELFTDAGDHALNPGRRTLTLVVENTGDRPIQVGSHYHFAETNGALRLRPRRPRAACAEHRLGHRGALRAGPAAHGGTGRLRRRPRGLRLPRPGARKTLTDGNASGTRRAYAEMFGPTVGDRVRLADTELVIEVEDDYTLRAGGYGEEVKFGGGKTIRDGMGQGQRSQRAEPARRGRLRDHQRADRRPLGHRQGRHRPQGRRASPPSARPATPTCSRASTSSSAPAPRSSPAKA